MEILRDIGIILLAYLAIALPGGFLAGIGWLILRRQHQRLLPPYQHRSVTWREAEVIVAVLTMILVDLFVFGLLSSIGFFTWAYQRELKPTESIADLARMGLWTTALARPCQVALILGVFRLASGTTPAQLGLRLRHGLQSLTWGYLVWLTLTPLVLLVEFVVLMVYLFLGKDLPDDHMLAKLIKTSPMLSDWLLVGFNALLAAPLFEEFLFRGVLQPWLARRSWGGEAALVGSLVMALLHWETQGAGPAIFVLVMVPGFYYAEALTWRWLPMRNQARTIYAVALLFAAVHSGVWPTPIPLFLMGLGLGWLAFRTQSLVAPITFHVLFNGLACVQLWLDANTKGH